MERARHSSHDTRLPSPRPATLPVWMRRTWSIVVGGRSLAQSASKAPRSGVSSSAVTTVASASRRSMSVATSSRARTLCFAMRFVRITAWIEPRSLRRGLNTEGFVSAGATFAARRATSRSNKPKFHSALHWLNLLVGERMTRKKKSKKMRGGVTRKLLTRRKVADLTREIGLGHGGSLNTRIKEFVRPMMTNQSIRMAVQDYLAGGARKRRIIEKYGEISNWDVSKVTNMFRMFYGASSFNQPLNNWDVSNVTDMWSMFDGAVSFNQPINNWDVSSVTNMSYMFEDAEYFNQPLNKWDVSSVTNMRGVFFGASSFNQPLNNWNVSNVTNMYRMFTGAVSFNQPLNKWNVSNVSGMESMFMGARSFNQPLNDWNVCKVTSICYTFAFANSFNQPLDNWNVSNVEYMVGMFSDARSFNQPLDKWNVSKVNNMAVMFEGARSFNQPLHAPWYVVEQSESE